MIGDHSEILVGDIYQNCTQTTPKYGMEDAVLVDSIRMMRRGCRRLAKISQLLPLH